MKNILTEKYLPLWAKETVLRDNRLLKRENRSLQERIRLLESYIDGLQLGIRSARKINIYGGKQ